MTRGNDIAIENADSVMLKAACLPRGLRSPRKACLIR
jgi:hypothetical protein